MQNSPSASVLICTRNRPHSIQDTLKALAESECFDFEILVVDSSDRENAELVKNACKKNGAMYISEPRPGLALARNAGIGLAKGGIIAFTDDDCIPDKNWISRTLSAFSDKSIWACTGRVIQHSGDGDSDFFEEIAGQDLGERRRLFSIGDVRFSIGKMFVHASKVFSKRMGSGAPAPWGIGHGSSMAFRRSVFEIAGRFDERFGVGAEFMSGEDVDMFYRILNAGGWIAYEPSIIVRHKHRIGSDETYKTKYGYGFGAAAIMKKHWKNPFMRLIFIGRMAQLKIKKAQYAMTGKSRLSKAFGSDLAGFAEGALAYRRSSSSTVLESKK